MTEAKTTKPVGAPTKYTEDTPDKLLEYFTGISEVVICGKSYPRFNSIEGFCASLKIAKSTFYEWIKIHPLLSNAFNAVKPMQADQLFQLGANRVFDSAYCKLLTINCTDMKDKVETVNENTNVEIKIDSDDNSL